MSAVLSLRDGRDETALVEAARVLRAGGVLAIPTESYYALGALAVHGEGVRRVGRIKGRPEGKPILVLIGDRSQLDGLVTGVPAAAAVLMDRFWPGPLTLILPAVSSLPPEITGGTGTVGVRLSGWAPLVPLLQRVGPLTGTSANRSGAPSLRTAASVAAELGTEVDLILDGGATPGGPPSTVVNMEGTLRVVREGPVSRQDLRQALQSIGAEIE
jgi:L-threonylcarbamoyladenylate synthase